MNNDKPPLLEYLRQFSGWLTGIVTFLTMLVGFAVLFRDNSQLITVLTVFITSIAAEIVFLRVATEKTAPLITGGKGVYRYIKLRKAAIVGIFTIPTFLLFFFTSTLGREISMV